MIRYTVSQNLFDESEGALFLMIPTDFVTKYINKKVEDRGY